MRAPPANPVLGQLQKNLMVALDERKAQLRAAGKRLFDFGLGDPKEPTPAFLREALKAAVPEVSQYPSAMARAAYFRWLKQGGDPTSNWLAAEQELTRGKVR